MPNWCANYIVIKGDPKSLMDLKTKLRTEHETNTGLKVDWFDFNQIVPEPADIGESWHDWRLENWGTKWPANCTEPPRQEMPGELKYVFDTAWSPPMAVLYTLMFEHPELEISIYASEPGNGICVYAVSLPGDRHWSLDIDLTQYTAGVTPSAMMLDFARDNDHAGLVRFIDVQESCLDIEDRLEGDQVDLNDPDALRELAGEVDAGDAGIYFHLAPHGGAIKLAQLKADGFYLNEMLTNHLAAPSAWEEFHLWSKLDWLNLDGGMRDLYLEAMGIAHDPVLLPAYVESLFPAADDFDTEWDSDDLDKLIALVDDVRGRIPKERMAAVLEGLQESIEESTWFWAIDRDRVRAAIAEWQGQAAVDASLGPAVTVPRPRPRMI